MGRAPHHRRTIAALNPNMNNAKAPDQKRNWSGAFHTRRRKTRKHDTITPDNTTQHEWRQDRDLNPGHLTVLRLSTPLASATRAPCQHHDNSARPRHTQTPWRGRRIADSQPPTRVRSLVTQHNRKRTVIRQSLLQTSIGKTITATARPHVTVSNVIIVAEQHVTIEGKQRTSGNLTQLRFNDATVGECHHANRTSSHFLLLQCSDSSAEHRLTSSTIPHKTSRPRDMCPGTPPVTSRSRYTAYAPT